MDQKVRQPVRLQVRGVRGVRGVRVTDIQLTRRHADSSSRSNELGLQGLVGNWTARHDRSFWDQQYDMDDEDP
jgi:hypothetical protein